MPPVYPHTNFVSKFSGRAYEKIKMFLLPRHHNHKLATNSVLMQVEKIEDLLRRPRNRLLVHFGKFARHYHTSVRPERTEVLERLHNAMGGSIKTKRRLDSPISRENVFLPLLCGKNPKKRKSDDGSPERDSAATTAEGPGIVTITVPGSSALIFETRNDPGSEIEGVPASDRK